jgi:hypothetical protein
MQQHLLYGPLLDKSCHLDIDKGVVRPLRWSREADSRARKWWRRSERQMVTFHGLKKLMECIQYLLPERKEVAQSAPNLQMVVGRGQIEREPWQGEASGLGTLSPGPLPLPPLTDLLLPLPLPLLGGRAFAFS